MNGTLSWLGERLLRYIRESTVEYHLKGIVVVTFIIIAATNLNRNIWSLMANHASANSRSISAPPLDHSRAPLWEARQALYDGDLDTAAFLVDPAASIEASRLSAAILFQQGNVNEAVAIWEASNDLPALITLAEDARASEQFDIALIALKSVVRIRPNLAEPFAAIAEIKREQTLAADAALWYGKAVAIQPRLPWRIRQAEATVAAGNLVEGILLYEALVLDYPERIDLYFMIAQLHSQNGNLESAILAIEEANMKSNNQRIQYLLLAADLYEQAQRTPEALLMYEAVLQINPNHLRSLRAVKRLAP